MNANTPKSAFVILRLNIRLKGYVYREQAYTPLDRGWFYHNIAAGSFRTKRLWRANTTLFDWTWILFTETTNSRFEPPFEGVLHIPRWKARGRLPPIRDNWTSFDSSYGWDIICRYWSTSAFNSTGCVSQEVKRKFQVEGDDAHQPLLVYEL